MDIAEFSVLTLRSALCVYLLYVNISRILKGKEFDGAAIDHAPNTHITLAAGLIAARNCFDLAAKTPAFIYTRSFFKIGQSLRAEIY